MNHFISFVLSVILVLQIASSLPPGPNRRQYYAGGPNRSAGGAGPRQRPSAEEGELNQGGQRYQPNYQQGQRPNSQEEAEEYPDLPAGEIDYDVGDQQDAQQESSEFDNRPETGAPVYRPGGGGQLEEQGDSEQQEQPDADYSQYEFNSPLPADINAHFQGPLPDLSDDGSKSQGFMAGVPAGFPTLKDFGSGFEGNFEDHGPQKGGAVDIDDTGNDSHLQGDGQRYEEEQEGDVDVDDAPADEDVFHAEPARAFQRPQKQHQQFNRGPQMPAGANKRFSNVQGPPRGGWRQQ